MGEERSSSYTDGQRKQSGQYRKPAVAHRTPLESQEDKVWIEFYQRVSDPMVAHEVLQYLKSDDDLKSKHPGLFVKCKQSIRRHEDRQARLTRIGRSVRKILHVLFVIPVIGAMKACRFTGAVAVSCLPEGEVEPAVLRARKLRQKPEASLKEKPEAPIDAHGQASPPADQHDRLHKSA